MCKTKCKIGRALRERSCDGQEPEMQSELLWISVKMSHKKYAKGKKNRFTPKK